LAAQLQQSSDDEMQQVHEINVTPFIDVILVLLIIFMIAAPLATVDIPVDLPASTVKRQQRPDKPVFVTLKADRSIAVGENPVSKEALRGALLQAFSKEQQAQTQRIFVRADKTIPYGEVMGLMNDLRSAGFLKIALVALESGGAQ
jgi:TonB system transport protein ExbD (group 1)